MARRNRQSLRGRIAGATGTYLGNSGRHQLIAGNKLGSHKTVYRQLRKGFGIRYKRHITLYAGWLKSSHLASLCAAWERTPS